MIDVLICRPTEDREGCQDCEDCLPCISMYDDEFSDGHVNTRRTSSFPARPISSTLNMRVWDFKMSIQIRKLAFFSITSFSRQNSTTNVRSAAKFKAQLHQRRPSLKLLSWNAIEVIPWVIHWRLLTLKLRYCDNHFHKNQSWLRPKLRFYGGDQTIGCNVSVTKVRVTCGRSDDQGWLCHSIIPSLKIRVYRPTGFVQAS